MFLLGLSNITVLLVIPTEGSFQVLSGCIENESLNWAPREGIAPSTVEEEPRIFGEFKFAITERL